MAILKDLLVVGQTNCIGDVQASEFIEGGVSLINKYLTSATTSMSNYATSANVVTALNGKANTSDIKNGILTIQKNGTTLGSFSANQSGNITINVSGVQNTLSSTNKLNADYIQDGTSNKVYTASEKTKLSGIASGAEVNQKAFSVIKVNTTAISADTKTDTLTISAGTNVTLTATDSTTNKVVISAIDTKPGNAYRIIQVNTAATNCSATTSADTFIISAGTNVTLTRGTKQVTISAIDTKPGNAYRIIQVNDSATNCSATTSADTFIISAGTNVTLTRGTKKLTISAIDTKPGTLTTTAATTQSTATSEALTGNINLHKIAKTGKSSDLINDGNFITSAVTAMTYYATSANVVTALNNLDSLPSQSGNAGKFLTTNGSAASWANVATSNITIRNWSYS